MLFYCHITGRNLSVRRINESTYNIKQLNSFVVRCGIFMPRSHIQSV